MRFKTSGTLQEIGASKRPILQPVKDKTSNQNGNNNRFGVIGISWMKKKGMRQVRDMMASTALVMAPLVAKTVLGTLANWNKLIELLSDFVEEVSDLAKRDQPMIPVISFTGYNGSDEPTKMVKMKV